METGGFGFGFKVQPLSTLVATVMGLSPTPQHPAWGQVWNLLVVKQCVCWGVIVCSQLLGLFKNISMVLVFFCV